MSEVAKDPVAGPVLHFGAGDLVGALSERLERALSPGTAGPVPGGDESLVVGLFGEWGSGKTTLLRALEARFAERAEATAKRAAKSESATSLTLPVFFNAWRYEAEDHLIIPLLKTAERTVADWEEKQQTRGQKAWSWLRERGRWLSDSVVALFHGFKGSLAIPGIFEISLDPGAALEEEDKRHKERAAKKANEIERLASMYYDFHTHMRRVTGRESKKAGEPRLNLLFLVDDLDRCLPEKAVQMLESIKLFLEVDGCAFVVAVDDEVVTRGIAHRYRDYAAFDSTAYDSVAHSLHPDRFRRFRDARPAGLRQPVTGTEYLEKIIHLPLRIPQPTGSSVREFLCDRFPDLFVADKEGGAAVEEGLAENGGAQSDGPLPGTRQGAGTVGRPRTGGGLPAGEESARQGGSPQALLEVFLACVPAVPRKLVRAAELFRMLRRLAHARGFTDLDDATLARLVFLQLFAPQLYRFGRRQPVFLAVLEGWFASPIERTLDEVEADIEERWKTSERGETKDGQTINRYLLGTLERPLLALVREAASNRSGFDPRLLVLKDRPADTKLQRYYQLLDAEKPAVLRGTLFRDDLEPARLEDRDAFVTQLSGSDPLGWRNALEQEAERLAGRRLDDGTFGALLESGAERPAFEALDWLAALAPHLSPPQLFEAYRRTDVLARLADEGAAPGGDGP